MLKKSNLLRRNKSYSENENYPKHEQTLPIDTNEEGGSVAPSEFISHRSNNSSVDVLSLTTSRQEPITSHSMNDRYSMQSDPSFSSRLSVSSSDSLLSSTSDSASSSSRSMHTANSSPMDDDKVKKPIKTYKRKLMQKLLKNGKPRALISKKSSHLRNEPQDGSLSKIDRGVNHLGVTNGKTQNQKSHKSKYKRGNRNSDDDGPISLAILTDDGIQIKSRKPKSYEYEDYANILLPEGRKSISSSRTSFSSSVVSDSDSYMETRSMISCVTCLSDSISQLSVDTISTNVAINKSNNNSNPNERNKSKYHYGSVNGQIPTNTVIPYEMILNAKHVDIQSLRLHKYNTRGSSIDINNDLDQIKSIIRNNPSRNLVEISFAKPRRQDVVPKRLTLLVDGNVNKCSGDDEDDGIDIVEKILQRSYKNSKRKRNILVLINPYGGKGNAKKIFMRKSKKLLMASGFTFDIQYTKYKGHGIDIAQNMDIDKYDTIACASGDGIPHEVINGLYRRPDRVQAFNKLAITQIPCGSGNAMSVSCQWTNNPSYATLFLIKSVETRCDIMRISQPSHKDGHFILSFLSQTYGIIAESDINTEFIRWLGPARFELGVAFNILQRKKYPCDLYVKYFTRGKNDLKSHYLNEISTRGNMSYGDVSDNPNVDNANLQLNAYDNGCGGTNNYDIDNFITEDMFKIKYPLDQTVPSGWERVDPKLTNHLGIFYTGKMPYVAADTKFFPAALPSDGVMDMVLTDSRTPFTRMVPILLALDKGSHVLQPEVIHSKIYAYRLVPRQDEEGYNKGKGRNKEKCKDKDKNPGECSLESNDVEYGDDSTSKESGLLSIDGEKFPLETIQVDIIPKLCKFLLRNGHFVDTEFDTM